MSITGTFLSILGSGEESHVFEYIEEIHEVGESLIPMYLILHVGAVILHALCGKPILRGIKCPLDYMCQQSCWHLRCHFLFSTSVMLVICVVDIYNLS
tara:strand:+ start:669 stop:962 length:294 start_codon:yes stop_codon:yes gene_type:complete